MKDTPETRSSSRPGIQSRLRDLPLGELESLLARQLGDTAEIRERSRRIVATLQIEAGREPTGLESGEEHLVRFALNQTSQLPAPDR